MSNSAAWIKSIKANPLVVDSAPLPNPSANEVVIHNSAVSINPVDWKIQDYGAFVQSYPNVLGTDVAGVIHSVGSAVTRFKPGDRVLGHAAGLATGQPSGGAFQLYTCTFEILCAKIPDGMAFTDAVVLALALSTAAAGLFQKTHLALPFPVKDAPKSGKTILVWGGASSVGATAIQLAVGAGVDVATTASGRNFEFVKGLGAKWVFDYTKGSIVEDVVAELEGCGEFVGTYDAIGLESTWKASAEITKKLGGKTVVGTLPPPASGLSEGIKALGLMAFTIALDQKEVGEAVWGKYVAGALEDGSLKTKPDAIVIGKGLEMIQEGLDKQKKGVSAGKVVIAL
jgi:NADPH:quinone reductase-like Zn-dependent oxidoreductase